MGAGGVEVVKVALCRHRKVIYIQVNGTYTTPFGPCGHVKFARGGYMENMVTLIEASERSGLSVGHLRRLTHAGVLRGARRGKRLIVVNANDLAALDTPLAIE